MLTKRSTWEIKQQRPESQAFYYYLHSQKLLFAHNTYLKGKLTRRQDVA